MLELHGPGGVDCRGFDQLSPELNHQTQHGDMC